VSKTQITKKENDEFGSTCKASASVWEVPSSNFIRTLNTLPEKVCDVPQSFQATYIRDSNFKESNIASYPIFKHINIYNFMLNKTCS
jgi:hypothetical protein